MLQFHGRGRIATGEAERERVFGNASEREQNSDPERKGVAIVIDLDKVRRSEIRSRRSGVCEARVIAAGPGETVDTDGLRAGGQRRCGAAASVER
jgi:hypothetical protein